MVRKLLPWLTLTSASCFMALAGMPVAVQPVQLGSGALLLPAGLSVLFAFAWLLFPEPARPADRAWAGKPQLARLLRKVLETAKGGLVAALGAFGLVTGVPDLLTNGLSLFGATVATVGLALILAGGRIWLRAQKVNIWRA